MAAEAEEQHTVIHVVCDECDAANTVTHLEHSRDSKQYDLVAEAHHLLAEDHADETGHHVEVGESQGPPEDARSIAESLAQDVAGADPDSFEEGRF